ncbi:MAG: CPBP family intramembrane metalloprotease [Candidatus Eremiobacteraeota bacterium]|nr:CPBP family intramembrane metalloprotease [Candidatus Eremiobacteraeota bacterium]
MLLVCALIFATVLALTFMIVAGWAHVRDLQTMSWPLIASQFVAYAAGLGVMYRLLPALAHRSWRALGLRAPRWQDVAYGIGGTVVMLLASAAAAGVQESVFHLKADEVQVHWLRDARGAMIWMFAVLAIVGAPFFEEVAFRGFVFNAFRRYLPGWFAVVVTGIVFGLSHLQPGNGGAIVPLAVGGVVLTWVYYRTGSLVASMITHACFNLVPVVLIIGFHQA